MALLALLVVFSAGCDRARRDPANSGAGTPKLVPQTNMVLIHGGTFQRLKFPVTISHDFWMGKYEVTQAEFIAVMGTNTSHFTGDPNRPVEKVSFLAAVAYCQRLTTQERTRGRLTDSFEYRLPTEAEWEYACRAGSTNRFSFGNDVAMGDRFAWTAENSGATTHPVGQKEPNAWGLYDMHGNVWEWCQDWFAPYPAAPLTDPAGPATNKYKVFKGGGWNQDLPYGGASSRFMMGPQTGIHFVGFRVVLAPVR
jgi:formylglycine-generating enzyme required for sulfatase activity